MIWDVIDHPEKYADDEIREILRDEECRKLYQTMQEVDSALLQQEKEATDVNEAWEKFSEEHHLEEGVATNTKPLTTHFSWRKMAAAIIGFILFSGVAIAAIHTFIRKSQEPMLIAEDTELVADSVKKDTAKITSATEQKVEKEAIHKTFENVTFDKIMAEIAAYYNLQVKFESNEAKGLRLYYDWDSHRKIEDIIKELNQFENVDIVLQDNEIIVK